MKFRLEVFSVKDPEPGLSVTNPINISHHPKPLQVRENCIMLMFTVTICKSIP